MTPKDLQKFGIPWPDAHPKTREPFVTGTVSVTSQYEDFQFLPPSPPSRRVATEWASGEDGDEWPIAWRELTDEEWAEAEAAYRRAHEEWHRTTGRFRRKSGPDIVDGRFECASGATARGRYAEGAWHWQEVTCAWKR